MSNSDERQSALFDLDPAWAEHWRGMPEYTHEDQMPWGAVLVNFASREDKEAFERLVGQKVPMTSRVQQSIWFPAAEIGRIANARYQDES